VAFCSYVGVKDTATWSPNQVRADIYIKTRNRDHEHNEDLCKNGNLFYAQFVIMKPTQDAFSPAL